MTPDEQVEYAGLAAAVGRLTMALKQTEAALEAARSRIEELDARVPPEQDDVPDLGMS